MMKQRFFAIVALLLLIGAAQIVEARTVKGTVKGAGKPLDGVLVTDGFSIVQANYKGEYTLDLNEKAEFVYIITPQGYVADYSSGTPQFYQRLKDGQDVYNFDLLKMKGDPRHYVMITMADPQIDTRQDFDKLMNEALPDIKETASKYPDAQVAGIMLGDISWDVYSNNELVKDFCRQAGIPIYPCIGNHDYDKYLKPAEGADYAWQYKRDFGPVYYAFQLGEAYYVVLSDLLYTGHKGYKVTFEMEDQMRWLERLLRTAWNMGNRVYICAHAPVKSSPESAFIGGAERIFNMLAYKFEASFLTAHFHHNSNKDLGANIMEHNVGALCGNWWYPPVASDGTPRGYQVFEGYDRDIKEWYFKSTGHPREYQFKLFAPGRVADRPKAVVAKVWNWDSAWHIHWFQDGKFMGAMEQFYSFDPEYLEYVNGARVVDDYFPVRHNRFFSATPTEGAKDIRVEVTDRFGNKYTETIKL